MKIMSYPGLKRGTCGHIMAVFDSHLKCACCRDKGVGEDLCVQKKDCPICNAFTAEQKQQLAPPTYSQEGKETCQEDSYCLPCYFYPHLCGS